MKYISDTCCRENQNTRFVFNNVFSENFAVYEIMWKNIVKRDRPQTTLRHTRIACWIPKDINTHRQYVTLIAFPLQQRLHERASALRHYLSCLTFWLRDAPTSLTFNNCTFCPHCIYVYCKQRLVPLTALTDWFYNRDEKCLQRGTDWVFK
jgi:hypothetical protein